MNHDVRDLLTRELRERAGDVGGHPIDLSAVRHSARGIRRRRRIAAGAVAAAFLAVAVPAGLTLTDGVRGATPQPANPSPSVVETTPPRPDGPVTLTISGLPQGDPAGKAFVEVRERVLQTPDGPVDLPTAYLQITRFGDGWLAVAAAEQPEGGTEVVELDGSFTEQRSAPSGRWLRVDADGDRVAWVEHEDGDVFVVTALVKDGQEVARVRVTDARADAEVVGFLGDTVAFEVQDRRTGTSTFGVTTASGGTTPVEGFLRVTATSQATGLVAGLVSYDSLAARSCWAVAASGRQVWRTCEHSLGEFSPDGRFVVAGSGYADGLGSPTLTVLDARTGEPVVEFEPPRDTMVAVTQAGWEDADSVLATVMEGNRMRVLRADLSGRLEAVSDSYESRDMSLPVWFAELPRS